MEYMILIYGDESASSSASQAQLKAMYAEYGVYTQELMKAGVMRAGSELKPAYSRGPHQAPGRQLRPCRRLPAGRLRARARCLALGGHSGESRSLAHDCGEALRDRPTAALAAKCR